MGRPIFPSKLRWGQICNRCSGVHGDGWENAPDDYKREAFDLVDEMIPHEKLAWHGQEVTCDGRLNFDYDFRRSTEDGPWADGIPFDGRDVWRFTIVADDSKNDVWMVKSGTLRNLGPDSSYPRCWPWSEDDQLPRCRPPVDVPFPPKKKEVPVHYYIGPFGLTGKIAARMIFRSQLLREATEFVLFQRV